MKFTKTVKVNFYLCDGIKSPDDCRYLTYDCLLPATEHYKNNKNRSDIHLCKDCSFEEYNTKNRTYMGKLK